MRESQRRTAILLIAVFAFFVGGNTLFVHTHSDLGGHRVVHSHPFIPGGHHTHSDADLQLISLSNLMAATMSAGQSIEAPSPAIRLTAIFLVPDDCETVGTDRACAGIRGPPQMC